jgi:hypothetical protein
VSKKEDDAGGIPGVAGGSVDCRSVHHGVCFARRNVIGRPMFVYWSFVTPEDQYQMRGAGDRLGFLAHIVIHFFDETRWSRTLRIVR